MDKEKTGNGGNGGDGVTRHLWPGWLWSLINFFNPPQVPPGVHPALLSAAARLAPQTHFDVFALALPRLTSPIGLSVAMPASLLQLIIPNWNNTLNESLCVSAAGGAGSSLPVQFVYRIPEASFTKFGGALIDPLAGSVPLQSIIKLTASTFFLGYYHHFNCRSNIFCTNKSRAIISDGQKHKQHFKKYIF